MSTRPEVKDWEYSPCFECSLTHSCGGCRVEVASSNNETLSLFTDQLQQERDELQADNVLYGDKILNLKKQLTALKAENEKALTLLNRSHNCSEEINERIDLDYDIDSFLNGAQE